MSADDFRDYILGFIFYKYLSEKIERYADEQLAQENLTFKNLNDKNQKDQTYIEKL